MRSTLRLGVVVIAIAALAVAWRGLQTAPTPDPPRRAMLSPAGGILAPNEKPGALSLDVASARGADADATADALLRRLAYAQAWNDPQPPALAAFRDWTERYRGAPTPTARLALEAEGVALAQARRPVMRELIVQNPQRALSITVPVTVRQILPAAVLVELEARVAGQGDHSLLASTAESPAAPTASPLRRVAVIRGVEYIAHPYGRRAEQTTKEGTSLHGIALDGELALHESPLRVLDPGEALGSEPNPTCPVSDLAITPRTLASDANREMPNAVEAAGRVWEFCDPSMGMLETFEQRLIAAESGADPRVTLPLSSAADPRTVADAPTAWTTGTTKLLLIRVDFSDFPGEPVSVAAAQARLDNEVRLFFEESSYGQNTQIATVSSKVYRLPQTGIAYAVGNLQTQLHVDARAAAGADYDVANYDRVLVIFPRISPAEVPGSGFNYSGSAQVGGRNVWLNGSFTKTIFCHELGHTYGLEHANLWQVADGNPISAAGTSTEYGDIFDMMGNAVGRDHYNPWFKNRLGWLPDRAVTTVTKSGTYRIYRYDSKNASLDQPLALRIFRDGLRWYWIGHRQNFPANDSMTNGAYVFWGFDTRKQSQLLDLTTPGNSAADAALAIGATFNDSAYGIKIKPLARGGTDPAQWLDVEVTLSPVPQNYLISLGTSSPVLTIPFGLPSVQSIATGASHAVALLKDGRVLSWSSGAPDFGPTDVGDVAAVAAGRNTSGVLKRDGTVQLWGDNSFGQLNVPPGLTNVRRLSITAGGSVHAVKHDGTVVSWGNAFGRPPSALTDIVAVIEHTAIRLDGTLVYWGPNVPTPQFGLVAGAPPAGLSGVLDLAIGNSHALALKRDGTVVGWGDNSFGQINVPAGLINVVAIAAGARGSMALKADGTVVSWGENSAGGLSIPSLSTSVCAIASTTNHGLLLVGALPAITSQPENRTVTAGATVEFNASAAGSTTLTYQWRRNGVALIGATSPTLTLANVQAGDSGIYAVTVSDGSAFIASEGAALAVPGADTGGTNNNVSRLANLSTRAVVGTGGDILIPGIAIGGSGKKKLIVRASGPALAAAGVGGTLAKPQLKFFSGQNVLAENTGWSTGTDANSTALLSAFAQVGLPIFPPGSADCALLVEVDPGVYTATLSGIDGTTGVALVEIYEFGANAAKLTAISCRARVGTGGDVLIPGVTIAGSGNKKVIIRASGPALTAQGVGGVLAKPKLEVFSGANVIAENTGWSTAPNKAELSAATLASGLTPFPEGSADCAALLTLAPGGYTAKISGLNDTTGVALVEVYEVP